MRTQIAEREGTQQRIGDSVQQHVGVGMTGKPARMWNVDATEDQRTTRHQRVYIETGADAQRHRCLSPSQ
jgi:hypothetical protein